MEARKVAGTAQDVITVVSWSVGNCFHASDGDTCALMFVFRVLATVLKTL